MNWTKNNLILGFSKIDAEDVTLLQTIYTRKY